MLWSRYSLAPWFVTVTVKKSHCSIKYLDRRVARRIYCMERRNDGRSNRQTDRQTELPLTTARSNDATRRALIIFSIDIYQYHCHHQRNHHHRRPVIVESVRKRQRVVGKRPPASLSTPKTRVTISRRTSARTPTSSCKMLTAKKCSCLWKTSFRWIR